MKDEATVRNLGCFTRTPQETASVATSIERHRTSHDVDIEHHARNRQIELANDLKGRKAIYLDLKFWIGLRDADASGQASRYGELYNALRQAVLAGRAYCPISESCFLEVFKQSDPVTRRKTVELIDELSLGVTIIPFDLRIGTEIAHLLHAASTPEQVYPLEQLVWSKLS